MVRLEGPVLLVSVSAYLPVSVCLVVRLEGLVPLIYVSAYLPVSVSLSVCLSLCERVD